VWDVASSQARQQQAAAGSSNHGRQGRPCSGDDEQGPLEVVLVASTHSTACRRVDSCEGRDYALWFQEKTQILGFAEMDAPQGF